MAVQLLTKDDLKPIEALQHQMVDVLDRMVDKKPTRILRVQEIRKRCNYSPKMFNDRIEQLTAFGMFKDGQYAIIEEDLDRYIQHLKTKHLPK